MLFCIRMPNFVQIEAPSAEIWRHIHFSRWRPRPLNTTSGFVFFDVTACRRSKSISKPNFVQISSRYLNWRLTYNYFRFRNTNVRRIGILLPVSISTGTRYGHTYSGGRGTRRPMRSNQCRHFQWPRTTHNRDFKVTPVFDAEYVINGRRTRYTHI